jgi:hypothetical protein
MVSGRLIFYCEKKATAGLSERKVAFRSEQLPAVRRTIFRETLCFVLNAELNRRRI